MEKLQQNIETMVEDISVPTDRLNETVQLALSLGKQRKRPFYFRKQKLLVSLASIFVLVIVALLFASYSTDTALVQNGASIFAAYGDEGLQRLEEEGKVNSLGLEAVDKEIKVLLDEGYLDNYQLVLSYRLEYDESIKKKMSESLISMELFVNGVHQTGLTVSRAPEINENGDIIKFESTKSFPDNSEIEIHIKAINGIEGKWSFKFNLEKEEEYLVKTDLPPKSDDNGNSFAIKSARLTPSMLQLTARTEIHLEQELPGLSLLEMSIVARDSEGKMYIADPSSRSSNSEGAYEFIGTEKFVYETVDIPRAVDAYSYEIIPYIASFKGKEVPSEHGVGYQFDEITAPFTEGVILPLASKIKVSKIEHGDEETIVSYEMDPSIPVFPKIAERENDAKYKAISFERQGNHMIVTYPKVPETTDLEFFMYDATYKVFSELATEIDL